MRPTWHRYLDRNVPRYTSYPSALAFRDGLEAAPYEKALAGIGRDEPVSLYLHVPFCKQLCWYCGCNMKVENRDERIAAFTEHFLEEIELVGGKLGGRGRISQVHFGGGTPNTLCEADLIRVVAALRENFPLRETTPLVMEIDPRLAGAKQIEALDRAGITRFSIGVQDFDLDVQKAINRVQPFELVAKVVGELRHHGADDISLDVLYGLPRQTLCRFRRTIEQVIALSPERVSLFGYAHMPSRLKHQRLIREEELPGRSLRIALEEMAASMLMEAGYGRIGFDHYARPGTPLFEAAKSHRLHRNFQGFTEDPAQNVVALGPSAISSVHGVFAQNAKNIRTYAEAVERGRLPIERGVIATLEEEDIGRWIERLLCDLEGDLKQYCALTGTDPAVWERTSSALRPLIEDGIVRIEDDRVLIENEAKPLARLVASMFDPAVQGGLEFASPAV
jgi:oxygen-independent coproporphyrinogen-3 oxidase